METTPKTAPESRRDSFIFYRSFWEGICCLDEAGQLQLFQAVAAFALDGKEPQLTGVLEGMWKVMKPLIIKSQQNYINGKKGGAPKGSSNNPYGRRGKPKDAAQELTETNQELTENKGNYNYNYDNNKDYDLEIESKQKKRAVFSPPSLDEVKEYFCGGNFTSDPAAFYDHYEANGWVQKGGKPIKNWQAAARQWERRQAEFSPRTKAEPTTKTERLTEFSSHIIDKLTRPAATDDYDQWED